MFRPGNFFLFQKSIGRVVDLCALQDIRSPHNQAWARFQLWLLAVYPREAAQASELQLEHGDSCENQTWF